MTEQKAKTAATQSAIPPAAVKGAAEAFRQVLRARHPEMQFAVTWQNPDGTEGKVS
jgi:hypothetical protein